MTGQVLVKIFESSHRSLGRNLEGITHEESLIAPEPGGNSLNWVLGHLLFHRNLVMKLLGQPPAWDSPQATRYARGSAPLGPDDDPASLESLRAVLDESQGRIVAELCRPTRRKISRRQ